MKNKLFPLATTALVFCSCATNKVEQTWKSPNCPPGPVKKVAVIAVADQANVRPALENRFAQDIARHGQPSMPTTALLTLSEIKENKEAAAKRLQEEGADSILIVRLVGKSNSSYQARGAVPYLVPVASGYGYGWYGYYDVVFMDMSGNHSSMTDYLTMESSLFDLGTGQRLWSAQTRTVLKEFADRLAVADDLTDKITAAMRKDGVIR